VKHLLVSVIVALLVIPAIASRDPHPRRGARRMVLWLLVFNLLYVAYVTLVHANYFVPVR
jgi:hypothetical protein